jgi:hypothetical protein
MDEIINVKCKISNVKCKSGISEMKISLSHEFKFRKLLEKYNVLLTCGGGECKM